MRAERRGKPWLLPALVFLAAFLLSLCFRTAEPGFIPAQAADNLCTAARLRLAEWFRRPLYLERFDIIAAHPYYYETLIRLKNSFITAFSGAAVCAGGALMQTMFRNPLASPNVLGISTGVSLGNLAFIFVYGTRALSNLPARYPYCYAFAAGLMLLTVGLGQLAGRRRGRADITDMLIVGTVVSQFGGVLALYLQYRLIDADYTLAQIYQELALGVFVQTDAAALLLFTAGLAVSLVPVLLLRYRMNAAAFPDGEALSLGVRPRALRAVGLLCGGILSLTALIHCGSVGVIAMALPMICRFGHGADFRAVCLKSACYGGAILLVARSVCSMIYVAGMALPVNFAVSVMVLPVFVFALSRRGEAFE